MIQILNTPHHMVAFRVMGEVTKEDYHNMVVPAVGNLVKLIGEINFLLFLDTDVKNFTTGIWVEDAMMGLRNFGKWNRAAIVSDSEQLMYFASGFSYVALGECKGFRKGDFHTALQWVEGRN